MNKRILFLFSIFWTFVSYAQVTEYPYSWSHAIDYKITPILLPPLDLSEIAAEDSVNDLDKSLPWRYGITRDVDLNVKEDGFLTILPNGDRLWQLAIQSPNAINLSVNFNDFFLPEGTTLHIFNDDRSEVSKTYTDNENRTSNQLGSWFVRGDIIWLEYYEPSRTFQDVKLNLSGIIHGYRLGMVTQIAEERGLNDSGDCNFDVNCSVGADFDDKKDIIKKTVALLNLGNGYLCTASLVNNSAQDKKPYLLTANHCLENSDPAFWSVRFNWMSPTPVCGTGEESIDLQTNFTMSGATLRANNALTDFALVELFNDVPNAWDLVFAGWDNSDTNPLYEVGIHHPQGDIMKICRDDDGAVKEVANGKEVWLIGGVSAGTGNGWELGTTESGSSGSPLFDPAGRLIGQLYAGQSFCDGLNNNNDYDIYGRFGVSWDAGLTPETRLKDWLDPLNSGIATLETLQNLLSTPDNEFVGNLDIYPNPASISIEIMNNRFPNLSYKLVNVLGQQLQSGNIFNTYNSINVESFKEGIYFLYLIDGESENTITKKIIIAR